MLAARSSSPNTPVTSSIFFLNFSINERPRFWVMTVNVRDHLTFSPLPRHRAQSIVFRKIFVSSVLPVCKWPFLAICACACTCIRVHMCASAPHATWSELTGNILSFPFSFGHFKIHCTGCSFLQSLADGEYDT